MKLLFTIGYEGSSIADFIATLRAARVDILIDVRDVPVSRKPGFSKRLLAQHLENAEIKYLHLSELGDPKPGREAARRGDVEEFGRIFRKHLARKQSQLALYKAIDIASLSSACLFCYERDPAHCHRSIVAEAMINQSPFKMKHLGVRGGLASSSQEFSDFSYGILAVG